MRSKVDTVSHTISITSLSFKMTPILLTLATILLAYPAQCRPEPPSFRGGGGGGGYSAPPPPSNGYGAPQAQSPPQQQYGTPFSEYGPPQAAPVIHKHVYVHVPPPENEYPAPRRPIPTQAPQKHYKIVFIKAPTAPTPTVPQIPLQPQDEQKTLIYVLVKKPEEAPEINIPQPVPTQPSKPEVYFIRYKTQKQETGGYPDSGVPQSEYGTPSGGGGQNGY